MLFMCACLDNTAYLLYQTLSLEEKDSASDQSVIRNSILGSEGNWRPLPRLSLGNNIGGHSQSDHLLFEKITTSILSSENMAIFIIPPFCINEKVRKQLWKTSYFKI